MKKNNIPSGNKVLIIIGKVLVIVGICPIILTIIGAIIWLLCFDVFKEPVILSEIPQEFQVVNDNNFTAAVQFLDLNETYVAYYTYHGCFSKITVLKDNKPIKVVYTGTYPDFRIFEDKLIYALGDYIYSIDLLTGEKIKIAKTTCFAIYKEELIYKPMDINCLICVDLNTGERRTLLTNVYGNFSLVGDTIIYAESRSVFGRFSMIDSSCKTFSIENTPFRTYFWDYNLYGDELVSIDNSGLYFLNTKTNDHREATLFQDTGPYIEASSFDDKYVYISFEDHEVYGDIFIIPVDNELNGLWRFNIQTLEGEQVSDVVYDRLGYYGENLVGTIDNELYIIDTETFEATKLIAMK